MDAIKLMTKALSDKAIGTILGAYAKIIRYSELRRISDLDELLTKDLDYCIILYECRPDRGHWTALSRYNGIYEHFDSYGNKPDKSLEWVNLKMRRRLNEATPYLTNLLKTISISTTTSNIKTATATSIRAVRMPCIGSTD